MGGNVALPLLTLVLLQLLDSQQEGPDARIAVWFAEGPMLHAHKTFKHGNAKAVGALAVGNLLAVVLYCNVDDYAATYADVAFKIMLYARWEWAVQAWK